MEWRRRVERVECRRRCDPACGVPDSCCNNASGPSPEDKRSAGLDNSLGFVSCPVDPVVRLQKTKIRTGSAEVGNLFIKGTILWKEVVVSRYQCSQQASVVNTCQANQYCSRGENMRKFFVLLSLLVV